MAGPPVGARGGSQYEFIAIIQDDECIGGVSCGNECDTHLITAEEAVSLV